MSILYLNEGHFAGHHRDGVATQLWAVTPRLFDRLEFGLGFGPTLLFDTQPADIPPWFHDVHSIGVIYGASLTYYVSRHWLARVELSKTDAPGNFDTQLLTLGVGYRVGDTPDRAQHSDAAQPPRDVLSSNELNMFVGRSIVNDRNHVDGWDFGVEYRRSVAAPLQLSAAWLDEAIGSVGHHTNLIFEAWLVTSGFGPRFTIGIGAGPCVILQTHETDFVNTDSVRRKAGAVDATVGLTASYQFTRRLNARLEWNRAFSKSDDDRDIVSFGVGWSWGP